MQENSDASNFIENNKMKRRWIYRSLLILLIIFLLLFGLGQLSVWFIEKQSLAQSTRPLGDLRSLTTAIDEYFEDHNQLPVWSVGETNINGKLPRSSIYQSLPTFRHPQSDTERFATLTTPVQYLTGYYIDPYANKENDVRVNYSYITKPDSFIVFGVGLDGDNDITVDNFMAIDRSTSDSLLLKHWDPTNGTFSNGDIYRITFRENAD